MSLSFRSVSSSSLFSRWLGPKPDASTLTLSKVPIVSRSTESHSSCSVWRYWRTDLTCGVDIKWLLSSGSESFFFSVFLRYSCEFSDTLSTKRAWFAVAVYARNSWLLWKPMSALAQFTSRPIPSDLSLSVSPPWNPPDCLSAPTMFRISGSGWWLLPYMYSLKTLSLKVDDWTDPNS